jgi:hypothetical protein
VEEYVGVELCEVPEAVSGECHNGRQDPWWIKKSEEDWIERRLTRHGGVRKNLKDQMKRHCYE